MARTFIDKDGYRRFSDSGKLVSRWVMEKEFDRPLRRREVVHHVNRDKRDNHPGNLWVFGSQRSHNNTHKKDRRRFGFW